MIKDYEDFKKFFTKYVILLARTGAAISESCSLMRSRGLIL